jgi:hypothetical protein
MLVIRGNKAVADIYLGEFMRLFSHYAFRESLKFKGATSPAATARQHRSRRRSSPTVVASTGRKRRRACAETRRNASVSTSRA